MVKVKLSRSNAEGGKGEMVKVRCSRWSMRDGQMVKFRGSSWSNGQDGQGWMVKAKVR